MILAPVPDPETAMFQAQKTLVVQKQQMAAFPASVQALLGLVPAFPFPVHPFQASIREIVFRQDFQRLPCRVLFLAQRLP